MTDRQTIIFIFKLVTLPIGVDKVKIVFVSGFKSVITFISQNLKNELTYDGDCEGAVGLIPRAVSCNVSDGFLSNGEELGRGVNWFHLYPHLQGGRDSKIQE